MDFEDRLEQLEIELEKQREINEKQSQQVRLVFSLLLAGVSLFFGAEQVQRVTGLSVQQWIQEFGGIALMGSAAGIWKMEHDA